MTVMRYDPWNTLRDLQSDLERIFGPGSGRAGAMGRYNEENGETASNWLPAVDIREDEDSYLVQVDLPGVSPDDIDVAMESNGLLTIKGQRHPDSSDESGDWKRVERVRGTFFRRFTLPENVDADSIQARSRHGVLEITVPKRREEPAKRIKVESAED